MDLITRRESKRYPGLFVKKYTRKVFYQNLWALDSELLESRGHVELADGTIVIRPFTKIMNYQENGTTIDPNEHCLFVRKVNGFMACATYVPVVDDVVVSTTGSLDSDHVIMAEKYLDQAKEFIRWNYSVDGNAKTYMFEICDPDDKHIVPEFVGAYLIGQRLVSDENSYHSDWDNENSLDEIAHLMGVKRPCYGEGFFGDVLELSKKCHHEGYVVYGNSSGTALKIKSPYYLAAKAIARKKDILTLDKSRVEEEFFGIIDHLKLPEVVEMFNALNEQDRLL